MRKLTIAFAGLGMGMYLFVCFGIYTAFSMIELTPEAPMLISGSLDDVAPLTTGLQGEEHPIQLQNATIAE